MDTTGHVTRSSILLPPTHQVRLGELALSPDGTRLVYAVRDEEGRKLFLRDLDGEEVTLIPGTDGAVQPFFSPTGNGWDSSLAAS